MTQQNYSNPLSVGGNGDFYAYNSNSDPIEAFKGLIKTIADEPAQVEQKNLQDEARNKELSQLYTTSVPDFAFRWQGEQQKLADQHNDLGTQLYQAGYDPYKNGAALLDPDNADKFKQFHQIGNQLEQTSQNAKYLQDTWSGLTNSIRQNPAKYQDGALDTVNNFYNRPLSDIINGGQPAPDLTQLQKPYDFLAWSKAAKNAIDPTGNGHVIQRLPGAIENTFANEYNSNPQAKPYWAKTFAALPEQTRQQYAAAAITKNTSPDYLYGLDNAFQDLTGKKVSKPTEWEVYGPGNGRTQAAQGATYRQDLVNRMLNGTPGSGEELKAITQGKTNLLGDVTYYTTNNPNEIGINIPASTKFDPITGTTVKVPGKSVTIDKSDRKNAALTMNQIINDVTGEKVQPSALLTPSGKKHVLNGQGANSLVTPPSTHGQPKNKQKPTSGITWQ